MAAFNRDAALERQQIHEISLNVARRLLKVLERSRAAPPHIGADIEASARLIADIQREIDQLMAALPPRELMDIAVLTCLRPCLPACLSVATRRGATFS